MAQDGGKFVSLTHGRFLPPENTHCTHFSRDRVDSSAIDRSEGLLERKIPITPYGIKALTFRFVAQQINHCATAVSLLKLF